MDANRVNVYNRLRDFGVPSTVLDNIFKDNSDAQVLLNAFEALIVIRRRRGPVLGPQQNGTDN